MRRASIIASTALAVGLAGSTAALAESFNPNSEATGMSWRAWKTEVYNTARSSYLYPGGEIPSQAHVAPGLVYGGGPAAPVPYDPYTGAPAYAPGTAVPYPPAPPGY